MSKTQQGYLLIADITGYTLYLTQSELEHAQEILATLLKLLVDHTRPPLVISRLAGDAVISYGLREKFFQGQTFLELIEDTYVAFRRAIEQMALNNTCRCNACANVSSLDLKFFVHYGTFAMQHIGEREELVGSDVNLIHRLLKNQVTERTGMRAYTLYTGAAIRQLGIEDARETMVAHTETYEHLGQVEAWVQDMMPAWEAKRSAAHIRIPPDRVLLRAEAEIALPPEHVWDYLIQPEFRKTIQGSDRQEISHRAHGRVAPGSVYHCYHGEKVIPETVIDWQPFVRMVTQDVVPVPKTSVLVEFELEPVEKGTRLVQTISKASGPWYGRILSDLMVKKMEKQGKEDIVKFQRRIEADYAARGSDTSPQLWERGR